MESLKSELSTNNANGTHDDNPQKSTQNGNTPPPPMTNNKPPPPNIDMMMETDIQSIKNGKVYVRDEDHGWVPADLISQDEHTAVVKKQIPSNVDPIFDEEAVGGMLDADLSSRNMALTPKDEEEQEEEKGENGGGGRFGGGRFNFVSEEEDDEYGLDDDEDDNEGRFGSKRHFSGLETDPYDEILEPTTVHLKDYPRNMLPLQDLDDEGKRKRYGDMCDLPYLHEASILYNLKDRYEGRDGIPYTRTGDIVVAINPYRWIRGLYAEKTRQIYAEQFVWKANARARSELEPHLYETSSCAFKGLVRHGKNQSILVSGETGAGKTVSVKILMSHLATFHETKTSVYKEEDVKDGNSSRDDERLGIEASYYPLGGLIRWISSSVLGLSEEVKEKDEMEEIEATPEPNDEPEEMQQTNLIIQRVLDSNPLLEAFGNAKTSRNDNSSRFSKYVKLQFHVEYLNRTFPSCNIAGSRCETYLLEKSRVVYHEMDKNERTFHIFYQLLAAPESYKSKLWDGLSRTDASSFKYVGVNKTDTIEGLTDAQRWRRTVAALNIIGIKGDKLTTLMRALCVVLQLGNISFSSGPSGDDSSSVISNTDELTKLSELLGVPSSDISEALTFRKVTAGNAGSKDHETFKVPLSISQAIDTRDAFAKEIYSKLFDWLNENVNDATCAEKNYTKADRVKDFGIIGLLDIFGFESFEVNHFEQLCINHANERLQYKFTEDVFRSVKIEYRSEGLDLREVSFTDNKDVLTLMEGRMGLIKLLNEECVRPRGSDSGFVNKIYAHNSSKTVPLVRYNNYQKHEFAIQHYAGLVKYDATKFVAKNNDTLPEDLVECGVNCSNELIRKQFLTRKYGEQFGKRGTLMAQTVWTKFNKQLTALMDDVAKTRTWYVRCINPNRRKFAGVLDLQYTVSQLRYAGIVSAVTISREAFPNRLVFAHVQDRFWFLAKYDFLRSMKKAEAGMWERFVSRSDDSNERKDCDLLLTHLLQSMETVSRTGSITKAFVCGKTRVYFRAGALEYLEAERLLAYDRCATIIQSRVRMNAAKSQYKILRENPPEHRIERTETLQAWAVATLTENNPFLPFTLLLFRQVVGFPTWLFRPRYAPRPQPQSPR